jgi:hypothetical protein
MTNNDHKHLSDSTVDTPVPLAHVDTRAGILERWLKQALMSDAHVWHDKPMPHQRNRVIMVKAFGGAAALGLRVNLYHDTAEVTVDTVGTWQSTEPMDALTAMWYVKQRVGI